MSEHASHMCLHHKALQKWAMCRINSEQTMYVSLENERRLTSSEIKAQRHMEAYIRLWGVCQTVASGIFYQTHH